MATIAGPLVERERRPDLLSGTPRAGFIDRWIYVFTAASFVVITLVGFIPDAMMKVAMVQAGVAALGGKGGGGRPDMAQGGGPDGGEAPAAIAAIKALVKSA